MRASIDCPLCPTRTKSSTIPRRNGPNMSPQGGGGGRASALSRNFCGPGAQEASQLGAQVDAQVDANAELFKGSPVSSRSGLLRPPSAIVESLLSEPVASCHDIQLDV